MWGSLASSDRGQSEVLGAALLFGIVLTISVAVVLGGATVLEQSHAQTSMQSAQVSMSELDREIAAAEGGGAAPPPSGGSSFDGFSGEGEVEVRDSGWMNVTVEKEGTGQITEKNRSLGRIVYERDGSRLGYQGGGVWRRSSDESSVMVSPPNVDYRSGNDPSLTLSIVSISGETSDEEFSLERNTEPDRLYPDASTNPDLVNPLTPDHEVTIVVQSVYYEAWGDYFGSIVGPHNVIFRDDESKVIVELDPIGLIHDGRGAILSSAGTSELTNGVEVDSYDSSSGSLSHDGSAGDVFLEEAELNSQSTVNGDLFVQKSPFSITNGIKVSGRSIFGENPGFGPTNVMDLEPGGSATMKFGGLVSTREGLEIQKDVVIEDDVRVGETLTIPDDGSPTIDGSVYVHNDDSESGDVVVMKNGHITEDLVVDGDVQFESGARVDGEVIASGNVDGRSHVSASPIRDNAPDEVRMALLANPTLDPDIPEYESREEDIEDVADRFDDSNNNGDTTEIFANRLTCSMGSPPRRCHLDAGNYYLDDIEISDTQLELDTTSGDINIYVEENVLLSPISDDDSNIRVLGSGEANVYVGGNNNPSNPQFKLDGESTVSTGGDHRASQFRVYLKPSHTVDLTEDTEFTGVIDGPNGEDPGAEVIVNNDVQLWGTIYGHVSDVNKDAQIHYDEALNDDRSIENKFENGSGAVQYLRVIERDVQIED